MMQEPVTPGGPHPIGDPLDHRAVALGPAMPPPPPNMLSMAAVRAFLWRQRLILIGVILLALIAGLIITLLMTPKYMATASLRVEGIESPIVAGQDVADPGIPPVETDRYMRTVETLFHSRSMADEIVDSLNLQNNDTIVGNLDEDAMEGLSPEVAEQVRRQVAASVLVDAVTVGIQNNNRIMQVGYESEDPVLSARIANAYVDSFIQGRASDAAGANSYALNYLEDQIDQVRNRLQDSERQAIDYARANGIMGEPITGPASLSEDSSQAGATVSTVSVSNLASVSQTYAQARAGRIAAEQRWRAIANVPATQLPEVQASPLVQSLRAQQAQLRGNLSDLQERYRDDYPEVRELNAQLAELQDQVDRESGMIKEGIRRQFEIAQRQEQALNTEVERVSNATLDEQDRRVQYNIIDRDVEALRAQLAALLNRYNDISAASSVQSANVTKIDPAIVPLTPTSPNLLTNMLIALLLGTGLATGIAILRESFDDRVRSSSELERKLQLPALGRTPFVTEEIPEEIEDPFSPISEAYASIRASLDHARQRDHPVIQVTSSEAGEGKTTSAAALARKYASIGRRVLLVDLDMRRPGLAKLFGAEKPEYGTVDVLFSRQPLERALLPRTIENLDILPVAEIPANPVEIMSSGLIYEFIERYRRQYDVMLLDCAPVMGIADAPLLSSHCDAVVFVVEANRANFGKTKIAIRRLQDMNANIVGAILTKFKALEAGEGYNSEHNYYAYNSRSA